jgi:hypothetical protein
MNALISILWLLSLLNPAFSTGNVVRAEIQTCSGCKLNRLPSVRKFVIDEDIGALSFHGVSRKIIPGHNPDLVFFGEGEHEIKRIDMTPLKFEDLVETLLLNGFKRTKLEL